jgi:hypothetical protein
LKVADDEINRRLADWQAPEPKIRHGYMARYARQVSSASQGAGSVVRNEALLRLRFQDAAALEPKSIVYG